MPKLVRAASREVHTRIFDSRRWQGYAPREDDIVIATYSKCGTTWTQRIVSMLVFASPDPVPIWSVSPWPDMRLFGPIEATLANAAAQTHRRFFKTHMPYDALPVYEGVKFIHVARDGRDAAMSLHNHMANFKQGSLGRIQEINRDDPKFGGEDFTGGAPPDPAIFFHGWISDVEIETNGDAGASFFHVENTYWAARHDPNMLLVHYADLKKDLAGEIRRITAFLEIDVPESVWPSIVEAAGFEAMKSQGDALLPEAEDLWEGGSGRFITKGTNGRWKDVLHLADLEAYDAKVKAEFAPDLAAWVEHGRLGAA